MRETRARLTQSTVSIASPKRSVAAAADLDEAEHVALARDDVELADLGLEVALDDPIAAAAQVGLRDVLVIGAGRDRRGPAIGHGALHASS